MEIETIGSVAKSGMAYERASMELASRKLALANVAFSSIADAQAAFTQLQASSNTSNREVANADIRVKHDPSHPAANSDGYVYFLSVDHVSEMARLTTALRAYEANVRAYNTSSEMNAAALQIGGGN
ncbi:flagellar basal body rod protein FlgC [Catenovulum sediminis]|uniref:flagellar basal body rod protein FlgC n=1 Tax=Catenovulum sediminis TaxID=1740262 RepID=UPI00117DDCD1|nr:flagellar basal body rod C-terminal domain-containing protein [Catenovulum sediminis]